MSDIYFSFRGKANGSLGEPVTAGRTIATDPEIFPPGALALFASANLSPISREIYRSTSSLERFVLNQDKGSRSKTGEGRPFLRVGTTAESIAGSLKRKR